VRWCEALILLVLLLVLGSDLKERHLPSAGWGEPPPGLGKSGSLGRHGGNAIPPSFRTACCEAAKRTRDYRTPSTGYCEAAKRTPNPEPRTPNPEPRTTNDERRTTNDERRTKN
jgi:hypothetical protein